MVDFVGIASWVSFSTSFCRHLRASQKFIASHQSAVKINWSSSTDIHPSSWMDFQSMVHHRLKLTPAASGALFFFLSCQVNLHDLRLHVVHDNHSYSWAGKPGKPWMSWVFNKIRIHALTFYTALLSIQQPLHLPHWKYIWPWNHLHLLLQPPLVLISTPPYAKDSWIFLLQLNLNQIKTRLLFESTFQSKINMRNIHSCY